MDVYLIFQLDNPMEENRFGHYLTRNGWQRLTTGVYHAATRDLDEEKLWSKARGEFSFDPERDFFAIFKSESAFIPTKKYYTKKAPAWPKELSVADD